MKRSLLLLLFMIRATYCIDTHYFHHAQKPPTIQHQLTNTGNDYSPLVHNTVAKIVSAVSSIVVLGKFIANKVKEKQESNKNHMDDEEVIRMKQILQKQQRQLQDLLVLYSYYCHQKLPAPYKKRLKKRSSAIKKLLQGNMQLVNITSQPPFHNTFFIHQFDPMPIIPTVTKRVKLQQELAKEFYSMGEKTENLWQQYYTDEYIQQLIKRSVRCVEEGLACNQEGKVVQASIFADIGWAILDHVRATGEGMYYGALKTINVFLHPIKLTQNSGEVKKQFLYSLGQMTLDIVDFYMLAIKNPATAQKKLHVWQQSFGALVRKIEQDWHIKTSRDMTKFIAEFAVERVATYGIYNILGKIFLIARSNADKLTQKEEFFIQQNISEGVCPYYAESVHDVPCFLIGNVTRYKMTRRFL